MKKSKYSEIFAQSLQRQRRTMSLNGLLDFSDLPIKDLTQLSQQSALIKLVLNKVPIKSFDTLKEQKNLKEIVADDSKLESFSGLSQQPRLAKISFKNTPLAATENFRIAALVSIGQRLSVINDVPVTKAERRKAQCYPPIAKRLIDNGWVLQFPPPSLLDFQYLAKKFKIKKLNDDDYKAPLPPPSEESAPTSPKKQVDPSTLSFGERVASILRPLGFAIRFGPNMNEDIVSAVETICNVVAKIEDIQNEEEETKE